MGYSYQQKLKVFRQSDGEYMKSERLRGNPYHVTQRSERVKALDFINVPPIFYIYCCGYLLLRYILFHSFKIILISCKLNE